MSMTGLRTSLIAVVLALLAWNAAPILAADDLTLAPDLSFTDDSSSNFPIAAKNLSDAAIPADRATIIFFGTSRCWNTNREAERLVGLYPRYRGKVNFIVVDLNHTTSAQRVLMAKYYHGYIPTIAVVDRRGKLIYDRAGETSSERGETANLESLINSAN
jgi:thioredoxin-related protein